jgi:hypothetical protein
VIVSHAHRFIFIKTRKTAGTSIEISLSRYCGEHDILTPITLSDEPLRGVLGLAAQNYLCPSDGTDRSVLNRPVQRTLLKAVSKMDLARPRLVPRRLRASVSNHRGVDYLHERHYYNHMSAQEIVERLGSDAWNSYYKFCFDRDPLTKVVSDYVYRARYKSVDDYLDRHPLPIDYEQYHIGGAKAVDFVGRFESLVEDLTAALKVVGIAFDGWLPRAKARAPKGEKVILTSAQRETVEARFKAAYEVAASAQPQGVKA